MFKKIFFTLSPLLIYKISGNSMLPKYKNGDIVVAQRIAFHLKRKDIVIVTHPQTKRLVIKRIQQINGSRYFVVGDNKAESTDSRDFGWVTRKEIIGKVLV